MIYARIEDAPVYRGIHPRLDQALGLLTPEFLSSVGTETRQLDGSALYVTRFHIQTSDDPSRLFEHHRRYLDLFVTVEGCERIDLASACSMTVREQRGDYWGCEGEAEQSVILAPGRFLVLFPEDAHRPGTAVAEPASASRIVFKILYEEN